MKRTKKKERNGKTGIEERPQEPAAAAKSHGELKFGLKALVRQYVETRPGLEVLQAQTDSFILAYEEELQKRREELHAQAAKEQAEEGWTLVTSRSPWEGVAAQPPPPPPGQGDDEEREEGEPGGDDGRTVDGTGGPRRRGTKGVVGAAPGRKRPRAESLSGAVPKGDFYRFQARETRRNEIAELQKKFEEDKKRVAKMREARKFRPY